MARCDEWHLSKTEYVGELRNISEKEAKILIGGLQEFRIQLQANCKLRFGKEFL